MKLDDLIASPSPWLQPGGPQGEIVLATRVRLARNIAGRPFSSRLKPDERIELEALLKAAVLKALAAAGANWFELAELPEIDRRCLVERHLISRQHAQADHPRGVAVSGSETVAIMVNEEDHLRIQVLRSGLQLTEAVAEIIRRKGGAV